MNIKKLVLVSTRHVLGQNPVESRASVLGYEADLWPGDHTPVLKNSSGTSGSTICITQGSGFLALAKPGRFVYLSEQKIFKLPFGQLYMIMAGKKGLSYSCTTI